MHLLNNRERFPNVRTSWPAAAVHVRLEQSQSPANPASLAGVDIKNCVSWTSDHALKRSINSFCSGLRECTAHKKQHKQFHMQVAKAMHTSMHSGCKASFDTVCLLLFLLCGRSRRNLLQASRRLNVSPSYLTCSKVLEVAVLQLLHICASPFLHTPQISFACGRSFSASMSSNGCSRIATTIFNNHSPSIPQ